MPSLDGLISAIETGSAYDQLRLELAPRQWQDFGQSLQPLPVEVGHVLIERGATDRVAYFIESGALSAHLEDAGGHMRLAVLNPGTVVGEGGFLSGQPRSATVVTTARGRVWCLSPHRFEDLAQRHPPIGLALALAMGSVAVRRCNHPTRRLAIT
jgi:CRP-like cAMP-binding protein